jgi:hypothetical protein
MGPQPVMAGEEKVGAMGEPEAVPVITIHAGDTIATRRGPAVVRIAEHRGRQALFSLTTLDGAVFTLRRSLAGLVTRVTANEVAS